MILVNPKPLCRNVFKTLCFLIIRISHMQYSSIQTLWQKIASAKKKSIELNKLQQISA